MADITHNDSVVTESKLTEFYNDIKPFLGCPAYLTSEGNAEYYSTEEKVIGRWIDGKPLYQIVFDATFNGENITTLYTFTGDNRLDEIIGGNFIRYTYNGATTNNAKSSIPLNLFSTNGTTNISGYVTGASGTQVGKVIIKYTKANDSAATTIQEDPNEYSTDEKIIGKWIDGKPIYQKTIDCGALPNNSLKKVAHGISNIDAIVSIRGSAYNDNHNGFSFPLAETNSIYSVFVDKDGDYIRIETAADRSSLNHSYVTIQYTKTTD